MKGFNLGILALALSLQAAHADDADDLAAGSTQIAAMASGTQSGQGIQSLTSPFFAVVNSDEQTASISGKFNVSKVFHADDDYSDWLTITAQSPLSQGSSFTNLATLDGLAKATSVQVSLALFGGGPQWASPAKKQGQVTPKAEWNFTFDGKVGTEDHDYFDPATLIQHTAHTTPWQAGGAFKYLFSGGHTSLNLSFDYQEFSQDGDTGQQRTQCLTPDNCVTGFIGPPVLMHQGLLSGDLRWIDKIGTYPLGAEVNVTYDPIHDTEAVQVPIYFSTNTDGALSGGVRFDWTSTNHVATLGVFVSTTGFGLFH